MRALQISDLCHNCYGRRTPPVLLIRLSRRTHSVVHSGDHRHRRGTATTPVDQRSARMATLPVWNMETSSTGTAWYCRRPAQTAFPVMPRGNIHCHAAVIRQINIRGIHQHSWSPTYWETITGSPWKEPPRGSCPGIPSDPAHFYAWTVPGIGAGHQPDRTGGLQVCCHKCPNAASASASGLPVDAVPFTHG